MLIGYARVSTIDQNTDMQLSALRRAGVDQVHWEKTSAVSKRPVLHALLDQLTADDILVVYKLDRIARSLKDLLRIIEGLERVGAGFRSLTETVDTATPAGRLMLQMLGAVAEFERSLIRERSTAGQIAAYRRGVKLGRHKHATPPEKVDAMRSLYRAGGVTYAQVGTRFGLHESTVKRLITGKSTRPRMPVLGKLMDQHEKSI